MNNNWSRWHTIGLVAVIVGVALVGVLIPMTQILLTWLLILGGLVLFSMIAGHGITQRFWFGWMINEQNMMSLSRLQMFLWTVVVLSAFLTAALANMKAGHYDTATTIAIPEEVWLALGISTVSLVGSPLIQSQQKQKKTNKDAFETSAQALGLKTTPTVDKNASGQLFRYDTPKDARLYNLVQGEQVGNASVLDLSKLQNLFFTLILVGSYAAGLGSMLVSATSTISTTPISTFPALGTGVVALLGISHAGYLASKAVNRQPEGQPPEPQ